MKAEIVSHRLTVRYDDVDIASARKRDQLGAALVVKHASADKDDVSAEIGQPHHARRNIAAAQQTDAKAAGVHCAQRLRIAASRDLRFVERHVGKETAGLEFDPAMRIYKRQA